jgi:G3E family GTPase
LAEAAVDHVLVEVSALNSLRQIESWAPHFDKFTAHPQWIHVVDALDFSRDMSEPGASTSHDQTLERATLLVLNKCDLVTAKERDWCLARLCRLNPQAAWIETSYGEISDDVWNQTLHLEVAADFSSATETASPLPPLGSLLFQSARPFHPGRLWDWFQGDQPGLLRAKGIFWLATRHLVVGGMSRTRRQNSCGPAGVWWDALPREEWPQDEAALRHMQETWREPYGDRRQELVLIGEAPALSAVAENLERCLLTDAEFSLPWAEWSKFSDPFPPWDLTEA